MRKSLEIDVQLGNRKGIAIGYYNLGTIYNSRGEISKARDNWIRSRNMYHDIGMSHEVEDVQGWIDRLPGNKGVE